MALRIERKKDNRVVKCILHRIADIPEGVTISVANLGGTALLEGTPIGKGSNGMFAVCKTAKVLTEVNATGTSYEVAKGHHFKIGDYFGIMGKNAQKITDIDKSDLSKDVITLEATLGATVKVGTCAVETTGANQTLKIEPIAVCGSSHDVKPNDNLFVDAWVHAVVRESNAPAVNDKVKEALKNVSYV